MWDTDTFPSIWQQAIILPIPKPGKDHTDPQNYRPIALTSCLCKTMERMVNNRLVWYLETNKILTVYQSGFRKNRSTSDHVTRLEAYIREAFHGKKVVLGVFFDMEKAYDTCWKHGALMDLHQAGLRGHLPKFISNFLTERNFQVRCGSTLSGQFPQEVGFPQGSILSVTLFGMRINGIVKSINPAIQPFLFVDDLGICCQSVTVKQAENLIQLCINKIQEWCDQNGFKFSPTKSQCILFHRARSRTTEPSLKLNGTQIPIVAEVKFLGIIFDNNLSFIPHIKQLKSRCIKTLNLLKVVSNYEWGGDPKTLLTLYRDLIRSERRESR
jgi:hypothetical protein